jgi:predicted transcriptional regulator
MATKTVQVAVRFEREVIDKLQALAGKLQVSVSQLIRGAVAEYLRKESRRASFE